MDDEPHMRMQHYESEEGVCSVSDWLDCDRKRLKAKLNSHSEVYNHGIKELKSTIRQSRCSELGSVYTF